MSIATGAIRHVMAQRPPQQASPGDPPGQEEQVWLLPCDHAMVAGVTGSETRRDRSELSAPSAMIGEIISIRSECSRLRVGTTVFVTFGSPDARAAVTEPFGKSCAIVPVEQVHPISARLAFPPAESIERLAEACRAVRLAQIRGGERLGLFGNAIQRRMFRDVARLEGAKICAAVRRLDVAIVIGAEKTDLDAAMESLAPGGRLVIVSTAKAATCLDLGPVLSTGLTVIGCTGAEAFDVESALALLDLGEVLLG